MEAICLNESLNDFRFLMAIRARRITPARSIREAVRKRGGECSRAIFPKENMLDQPAYMKTTIRIDMGASIAEEDLICKEDHVK